jgi:hypothetical protein
MDRCDHFEIFSPNKEAKMVAIFDSKYSFCAHKLHDIAFQGKYQIYFSPEVG